MKDGQVSFELIIVIGILTLILLFLISLSLTKKIEITKTEKELNQRSECLKLASIILGVYINGNGTIMYDKLSYNATLKPRSRLIEVNDEVSISCTIPIDAISSRTLNKGAIKVTNIGDFIDVSNV